MIDDQRNIVEVAKLEGRRWQFLDEFAVNDRTEVVDTIADARTGISGVLNCLVQCFQLLDR